MNVSPMTIEQILRSRSRDRILVTGWLIENLFRALAVIAPDVAARAPRKVLTDYPIVERERTVDARGRFLPRWRRPHDEDGQTLAEYALIVALIAIVAIVALVFLGGQINDLFNRIGESI